MLRLLLSTLTGTRQKAAPAAVKPITMDICPWDGRYAATRARMQAVRKADARLAAVRKLKRETRQDVALELLRLHLESGLPHPSAVYIPETTETPETSTR